MSITITVAETVDDAAFARISSLAHRLQEVDINFEGVPLLVRRGPLSAVSLDITDSDDEMRERLLMLLLADVLKGEPNSMMGSLA